MQKTLKRQPGLCSVSLFLLLLLAACTGSEKMRRDLDALQEKNLSDSLLTDSTLALTLADYFDSHGTQAERLEAHYLLARTWTDLGQAPRALDAFHTAAEQADTTRLDSLSCHWLSRIYGQMADLLIVNKLPYNAIRSIDAASVYAQQANEQAVANMIYSHKGRCYFEMGLLDSVVAVEINTSQRFLKCGDTLFANVSMGPLSYCYVKKNMLAEARKCLHLYEYHSVYNALSSSDKWKLLSYYKGLYHQHAGNSDSALYYFYKQLDDSKHPNNIGLAYQGLYQIYHHKNQTDSAEKYAVLNAELSDSIFRENTTSALLSMQHLYDYTCFKQLADKKTMEAEKAKDNATFLFILVLLLIMIVLLGYRYQRNRIKLTRQRMNAKYVTDILTYSKLKAEMETISQSNIEQRKNMEMELNRLKDCLVQQQSVHLTSEQWKKTEELFEMPILSIFHTAASQGRMVSDEAWNELRKVFNTMMPNYLELLSQGCWEPNYVETQLIILTKFRFLISEIGVLLNLSPSALAQKRKRLYKKMTGKDGSSSDFDKYVRMEIMCS